MELVQTQLMRWSRLGLALSVLAVALTGCVETKELLWGVEKDCPCKGEVFEIAATWQNEVRQSHDPTRGGALTPIMAGRIYLFGPKGFPVEGDGTFVIEMHMEGSTGETVLLERYELVDQETLKRLLKKDLIGYGYTVPLPWPSVRPDITQLRLKVRYDPAKGLPLFTENVVTINNQARTTSTAAANEANPTPLAQPVTAKPTISLQPLSTTQLMSLPESP